MDVSPIDILIFAPLAPLLGVLLFWFIQLLFIEFQKHLLLKIKPKHEALCRFTNFIGILFQTVCHALGYAVTKSGISHFYITVHYGEVKPKKEKKGLFEWISNSFLFFGPFFIPAALLFIYFFFLVNDGFDVLGSSDVDFYSFGNQMIGFGVSLYTFSSKLFGFLFSIDLLHPAHLGFLFILIFLGMGIRPSYIGEEKIKKVDMIYDLRNIESHMLHKPIYVFILFLLAYDIFYISVLLQQNWYLMLFSIFGWLSVIAIVSLIIAKMIILLIKITDKIPKHWKLVPYITLPASYIFMRLLFYFIAFEFEKTVSLVFMIGLTTLVIFLLLKYKTNTFKTKTEMKPLRVEDGPKRIIRE